MNDLQSTKLINILSVITRSEWRIFMNFINSGIGGPYGRSLELYNYLSESHPRFDSGALSKKQIFSSLFPGEGFEDKKLRYAMTDLYRQACSFLSFSSIQENPQTSQILIQEILSKRGADKAYLSHYKSDVKTCNIDAGRNVEFYFNKFRETFIHLNHYLPRQQRSDYNPIGEAANYLDIFYIAQKLQLLCEIINVRNVMSVSYDFFLHDEIVIQLKNGAFEDVPVIAIYYRILMTLTESENESHFIELRKLLESKSAGFDKSEVRDMYQYLMNYCIKKINQGNLTYVQVLFEIYQRVLAEKILLIKENLSQWDYKNIVVIGLRANQQKWVNDFIEKYKVNLSETERANAYNYNRAYFEFGAGNYKKAITLLQQVEFTDLYYQLDMRALLLKCYYEMDDEETLLYHLAAFRIFLSRNKLISDYQRKTYRNLIRFTNQLVRNTSNKKKLQNILQEVDEIKQIADLGWLRKKINEKM